MSNPIFEDESILFLVLINEQQQYSLWPQVLAIPAGWQCVQGPMSREQCTDWLAENWTDLRPVPPAKDSKERAIS